ncbi:putative quinol monooxygenase [Streptomyces liangshanensis]|uniref:Antibiotic biosynthesis monooxygenase n=1 Tax=Streptomyces liangshanensis TaxID=2717324 RepID=A0A6G9GV86_9ACTN|nr:putative quinol monooxygenase [Streptomyces liangshanensis]QIQ02182.1 antibiotic biosynthesis monooxygenase [Streptomyces liangshanensis]
MFQFLVSFTVEPEHREDFVRAARKTARDSLANEPGSNRFEVIADEADPDVFYLNEVYEDADAFTAHAGGPYFTAFFAEASAYAKGPNWLMKGNVVPESAAA